MGEKDIFHDQRNEIGHSKNNKKKLGLGTCNTISREVNVKS